MDKIWKALLMSLSASLEGKIHGIYHVVPQGAKPPYITLSLDPIITSNLLPIGFQRKVITGTVDIWSSHKGLQELSSLMSLVKDVLEPKSFEFDPEGSGLVKITEQKIWPPDPKLYPLQRGSMSFKILIRS
jgi:hypothetical protein